MTVPPVTGITDSGSDSDAWAAPAGVTAALRRSPPAAAAVRVHEAWARAFRVSCLDVGMSELHPKLENELI